MCLELYTFEFLQPTNLLAHVARERERASPKKMERCFKDVVDNIFLLFSGFPLYCLFWGCYITCIYIYIYYDCVCHTVESFMAGRARGG